MDNERKFRLFYPTGILPPAFRGRSTFVVSVGQTSLYEFAVDDASNGLSVGLVGGIPQGATLKESQGSYQFLWNLSSIPSSSINDYSLKFYAINSINQTTYHTVYVMICNCKNGGNCTFNALQGNYTHSIILSCLCSRGILYKCGHMPSVPFLHAQYSIQWSVL